FVRELAKNYAGIDPVYEPIPVRPVVHYMMGGVSTDKDGATVLPGLFAAGECACVSINGANRLGSNSLTELPAFGAPAARPPRRPASPPTTHAPTPRRCRHNARPRSGGSCSAGSKATRRSRARPSHRSAWT